MKSKMTKKQCAKFYLRVFPMERMKWDYVKILDDSKTVYIRTLQQLSKTREHLAPTFWTFRTEHVFFKQSQSEIYNKVIPDVLDSISQNQDAVIMSFGQTGTGKSLTINGVYQTFMERGILPRLTADLFRDVRKKASKNNVNMCIQVSYVEFSKTHVYDLLKSYPNRVEALKNISKRKVRSVEETLRIIFKGEGRKIFSENASYPSHSCSSVFTFYLGTRRREMQDEVVQKCKLHFIDLAGTDTAGTTCLIKNAQQVGAANLAKSQLEQFILILRTDIPDFINIKQRLNPMIHFLGDSLKKTSIFRLIGHIRVCREDLLITISMLRFGELIAGLKATKYEMNIGRFTHSTRDRLDNLEKELAKLKLENQNSAKFMQQDLAKSINEERLAHIERTINEYLQNKISQVALLNVCDVNVALEILKMICIKSEEEKSADGPKMKKISSGLIHKVSPKISKSGQKSTHSGILTKKIPSERSRYSADSGDLRVFAKEKIPSTTDATRLKLKTSSSSLTKRGHAGKRKSSSSTSLTRTRSKSNKSTEMFMPEIPPEYNEAWNAYQNERSEEYARFLDLYRRNEIAAKTTYRSYLSELEKLKDILARVEKHKDDLLLAKLTQNFRQVGSHVDADTSLSEFQKCCMEQLQKAEQEKVVAQDSALKYQAELRVHITICNDMKKDLDDSFNAFCREKYHVPVLTIESEEVVGMNVLQFLDKEEKVEQELVIPENTDALLFEKFKGLIEPEKRKRRVYLTKRRQWSAY